MSILSELKNHASEEKARLLAGFFKTGKGQYGEGDVFLGVMVPESRKVAKRYINISLDEVAKSLKSKFHEERLVALFILVEKFNNSENKKKIVDFYLNNLENVNNWDLVDLSASRILGTYLLDRDKSILRKLAKSVNVWERRVSIISTLAFVKEGIFNDSLEITKILLQDKHDLIHKACGWVLREVGKKDKKVLDKFLIENYKKMPRTMLRYSIEKHNKEERERYLRGLV